MHRSTVSAVNDLTHTPPDVPLWREILNGAERIEAAVEARLAATGLSTSKLSVLRTLAEGDAIPLSRLAERLACVKSNVTQLVDRLEADGLVARVPDPSDRRSILASITPTGRERYAAATALLERTEAELFEGISPEERDGLRALFRRIAPKDCGR
jgi:MarR family transcriptional regulator, transcriptional regulator for hemolysin